MDYYKETREILSLGSQSALSQYNPYCRMVEAEAKKQSKQKRGRLFRWVPCDTKTCLQLLWAVYSLCFLTYFLKNQKSLTFFDWLSFHWVFSTGNTLVSNYISEIYAFIFEMLLMPWNIKLICFYKQVLIEFKNLFKADGIVIWLENLKCSNN